MATIHLPLTADRLKRITQCADRGSTIRKDRQMSERAIIYYRVSSEEQGKGFSLRSQVEGCRVYCEKRGYTIVGEFSDQFTGTTSDRPGLNTLREQMTQLRPDVVVAWDLDRLLGRDELSQVLVKYELLDAGARIEYARDGSGHSEDDELMQGFKQLIARRENADRRERARRGQRGRLREGHVMVAGAGPPYGYDYLPDKKKGRLVVNEDEANVVRNVFRWVVNEGLSAYAVARRLHESGIPTRGDRRRAEDRRTRKESGVAVWHPSTVTKMIRQPAYKGEWIFGTTKRTKRRNMIKPDGDRYKTTHFNVKTDESEWIRVPVPAIVDAETWQRAQEQLATNKRFAKPPQRKYLLRSMIFCGACGKRWVGAGVYYRCAYADGKNKPWLPACDARKIRTSMLDEIVWDHLVAYALNPDHVRAKVEQLRHEMAGDRAKHEQRLAAVTTEIEIIDWRLSQLLDQALNGFPDEVISAKRDELMDRRTTLVVESERLRSQREMIVLSPGAEDLYHELAAATWHGLKDKTFEERRQLLRQLRLRVQILEQGRVQVAGVLSSALLTIPSR